MKSLKGKMLVSLASVAMLGGVTLGSVGAFASTIERTDVQVQFNPYTGGGENPGNLALAYVPGGIDFGNNTIVAAPSPESYSGNTNGANFVAVDDDRPAGTTWALGAAASVLESTTTSQTISSGNIRLMSTTDVLNYDVNVGTPLVSGALGGPVAAGTISRQTTATDSELILGGGSVDIAWTSASQNQGYAIPIDSVNLNITTQNAYSGQTFTGKITWTLRDTI